VSWDRLFERLTPADWPDGKDHTPALRKAINTLSKGMGFANEIGDFFLKGRALAVWRKALRAGPAESIEATLANLKQDDGLEPCACVAWMPASELAASPRRYVRLIGLNSSRWPRGITEDRLIPDHIVSTSELDPLPVNLADRRDFETILATTSDIVVLSRARRDSDGRLLGRSPLLAEFVNETYLRRNGRPNHAFSETDRLMARPQEFSSDPQATSAQACWSDWRQTQITAHDGLVRDKHPLIQQILNRTQSASSLRRLLRNPLSFVWVYAFGWHEPQSNEEPLVLDPIDFGKLVHMVLDQTVRSLHGGIASADENTVKAAVEKAVQQVAADWESKLPFPPSLIWSRTLNETRKLANQAINHEQYTLAGVRTYSEVPFGGMKPKSDANLPWDATLPVSIPNTDFKIAGYIDRLDISGDGKQAIVRDYKTGVTPSGDSRINGGRELQRCLYSFAVKSLLGNDISISASLLYLREPVDFQLENPESVLEEISGHLIAARSSLSGGAALLGPDTGGDYDDLIFALPANAAGTYCKRKMPAAMERLGDVARVWEAE
jgi:hypothetical protein